MTERETLVVAHHQLQRGGMVQRRADNLVGDGGSALKQPPVEPAAQQRRSIQDPALAGVEAGQAGAHRVREPGRDPAQVAGGQQVLDQQREPFGRLHHRRHLVFRQRLVTGAREGHIPRLVAGQTTEMAHLRAGRPQQGRDVGPAFASTGGGQYSDRHLVRVVGQVPRHRERRVIGPVQVLQDHHDALAFGGPAQDPKHRLGRDQDRLSGRRPPWWPPVRHRGRQHGQVGSQLLVGWNRAPSTDVLDDFSDRSERTADSGRHGPAGHHPDAGPGGQGAHVLSEPALADPRLTRDDQGTAAA